MSFNYSLYRELQAAIDKHPKLGYAVTTTSLAFVVAEIFHFFEDEYDPEIGLRHFGVLVNNHLKKMQEQEQCKEHVLNS